MEFNYYRIGTGALLGISIVALGSVLLAVVLHRRAGFSWGRSIWVALSVVSAAAVLLITLEPSGRGGTYPCEFDIQGSIASSVFAWTRGNQSTANVVMFVPVAIALPLATRGTRWFRWSFVALVALPLLIEALQATIPLGRACDGMDVVDNWFGVAFGCLVGWAWRTLASSRSSDAAAPATGD